MNENLSPALASMVAQILMPVQYATIMGTAVLSVNSKCKLTASRIDK